MNNKFKIGLISLLTFFSFILAPALFADQSVNALNSSLPIVNIEESQTSAFLIKAGFSKEVETEHIVASIIKTVLTFLGIIFIILMILSGYQWMMAGGNEETVKKAQARIKNAVIGLVIVLFAYSITAFIFKRLPGATIGGTQTGAPL